MIYNQLLDGSSVDQWLEERGQNIFWTISNQYQKSMPRKFENNSFFETRHYAILWGGIFRYMDIPLIQAFIKDLRSRPDFYALFSKILWMAIEEYCIPKLAVERPAITEICMEFYQEMHQKMKKNKAKDSAEVLEKSYYAEKISQLSKDNRWLKDLIGEIISLSHRAEDTMELLTGLEEIYKGYFVTESWIDKMVVNEEIADAAKHQATKYKPAEDTFIERQKGVTANEIFVERIVDAEFNPNSYRGKASQEYLDKEREKSAKLEKTVKRSKQSDFDKIRIFFGDLLLSPAEIDGIEQKISTGRHQNKKLYITTGNFSSMFSEYQLRFLEQQRRLNLEYYEAHYRECRRHIESLRSLLINVLLPDSQEEIHQTNYGRFQAGKAWRLEAINDYKIFEHIHKNEIGNFVVEILLDGSGSQSERQREVAMQGYIIAQALGLCHIPCRVSAYATFLDYTIFRIYKDFNSPLEQNKRIFDFFGTGMNRDGFAMRAMGEFFKKRDEENKILIVLSDGKPNDVRIFKKEAKNIDLSEYSGDLAVKDTAMEVRKLRLQGISVLGVFNGLEQDLPAQQKIYGHDFAYIKKIDQFSKIVGTYLKKELRQLM